MDSILEILPKGFYAILRTATVVLCKQMNRRPPGGDPGTGQQERDLSPEAERHPESSLIQTQVLAGQRTLLGRCLGEPGSQTFE